MGYPVQKPKPTTAKVIKIAFVNPRQENQFSASVKDSDNDLYWVGEDMLPMFEQHKIYSIEFETSFSQKTGKENRKIVSAERVSEAEPLAVAAKVAQVVRQAQPSATPRPTYNNNPGAAVMGMVNQYINRGDVPLNAESIASVIDECEAGYRQSKLGKAV